MPLSSDLGATTGGHGTPPADAGAPNAAAGDGPSSVPAAATIEQAGIYPTMPEAEYHADPALSHSGAKLLLECPARFRWTQTHPRFSADFDFGNAAHRAVLGAGRDVVVIDADDWRSKDARTARDEARAAGKVPMLARDAETVADMRAALLAHPIAGRLFTDGAPEQSMFWRDTTGVMLRARADWLRNIDTTRRRDIIPDYKTCQRADVSSFGKSTANFGYHQQAAWYVDGWRTLTGRDAAFVFVAQEKEPPYLVNVMELDDEALDIGRARNRRAIDLYLRCVETNTWPGYADDVQVVRLPRWAVIAEEQTEQQGDDQPW